MFSLLTDLPREGHTDDHSDRQRHRQLDTVGKVAASGLTYLNNITHEYVCVHHTCNGHTCGEKLQVPCRPIGQSINKSIDQSISKKHAIDRSINQSTNKSSNIQYQRTMKQHKQAIKQINQPIGQSIKPIYSRNKPINPSYQSTNQPSEARAHTQTHTDKTLIHTHKQQRCNQPLTTEASDSSRAVRTPTAFSSRSNQEISCRTCRYITYHGSRITQVSYSGKQREHSKTLSNVYICMIHDTQQ